MNPLGVLIGLALMLILAETGELPMVLLALLLFLNVADEDTVIALARRLGKLYYKLNRGIWELLGLEKDELKLNEVVNEVLRKEASWRAQRISKLKKGVDREEVLKMIYKRIMEESGLEGLDVRSITKKGG